MNLKRRICFAAVCLIAGLLHAQTSAKTEASPKEYPLISAGAGLSLFKGDVGANASAGSSFRSAWRFGIEQRLGNWIGAELFGHYGTLSKSERSLNSNVNFQSPILFAGANAVVYFDNNLFLPRNSIFAPYLTVGFGWMSFDPHADLTDANGRNYYYWGNGSIHDLAETDPNAANSIILQRDYTYETKLTDSLSNYSRSTFGVPVGLGLRFHFGNHFGTQIQANYFLTFSDYIDNTKSGGNDSWWWYGCSLFYKFGNYQKNYSKAEIKTMMNEDYDGDGVADKDDNCQGTAGGVKVDRNGCPLDDDKDGVPDYKDKEPNTKKGLVVDENGVGLDFEKIKQQAERDSINDAQKTTFNTNPSLETLKKGDQDAQPTNSNYPDCLPVEYRDADFNKDCVITADEINRVIDNFFDGTGNWTADSINRLIDFFFDQ
jgi:Outer membrane protein beta-barrel domain/Thrombospondin type 3 repeat